MTRIPSALLRTVGGSRPGVSPLYIFLALLALSMIRFGTTHKAMGCLRALLSLQQLCL